MADKPGWDERDYLLWSELQGLPSYGLLPGPDPDWMISLKSAVEAMEKLAKKRKDSDRG